MHVCLIFTFKADADSREQRLDNGLIIGHAYTVTDVRTVSSYGTISAFYHNLIHDV